MFRKTTTTLLAFTAAFAFVATAAFADPGSEKPRILKVQGKDVKVWGVPISRHFTKNNLFPNPTQRCPTLLVLAEEVTDPAILKKYRVPKGDYLYHFQCLSEEPKPKS